MSNFVVLCLQNKIIWGLNMYGAWILIPILMVGLWIIDKYDSKNKTK